LLVVAALGATAFMFALLAQPLPVAARPAAATNLANTANDSRHPAIVVTGGAQHVVWEESVDISPTLTVPHIWHRWWNGVTWSPAITVSTGRTPALAVGPDNTVHAAWVDDVVGGSPAIFYSNWNGAAWSLSRQVAPGVSGSASQPAIIVNALNLVQVTWGQFDPGLPGYRLYYATAPGGGSGAWTAVPLNGAKGGNTPAMALDVTGTLHLAWQAGAFGANEIYYASLVNTNTISVAENVSQSPAFDSKWPSLAIGADNLPAIVWSESDGAQFDVVGSAHRGGIWTAPFNISASSMDSTVPRLSRSGGALVAAWNEASAPARIMWSLGTGAAWGPGKSLVAGGGAWYDVALVATPSAAV